MNNQKENIILDETVLTSDEVNIHFDLVLGDMLSGKTADALERTLAFMEKVRQVRKLLNDKALREYSRYVANLQYIEDELTRQAIQMHHMLHHNSPGTRNQMLN
jgi:hypothetical protein